MQGQFSGSSGPLILGIAHEVDDYWSVHFNSAVTIAPFTEWSTLEFNDGTGWAPALGGAVIDGTHIEAQFPGTISGTPYDFRMLTPDPLIIPTPAAPVSGVTTG